MNKWHCPECPKTFSRKGDLTRHSLLHTGRRPYVCSECGKGFAQHSGLRTHENVHTREKPFRCGSNGCQAAFGDPSSRARHRKETHCSPGAFRCPDARCKSSIKRRSAFTAHLRKHGMKYMGVDIDDFYSETAPTSRGSRGAVSQLLLSKSEHAMNFDDMAHTIQPDYDFPNDMLVHINDYSNNLRPQIDTEDLFIFSPRASLSPPSLAFSSPSASPSPCPLDFPEEQPQFAGLPHINIADANALDPSMSGAYLALSPISQFMFNCGYDPNEHIKPPMEWA